MVTQFVQHLSIDRYSAPQKTEYLFSLPLTRQLGRLAMHPAVPYFVGENGSGKLTLLEVIAVALGDNTEGGTRGYFTQPLSFAFIAPSVSHGESRCSAP